MGRDLTSLQYPTANSRRALGVEGSVEWRVVRLEGTGQRPSLGDKLRIADLAGWGL